MGGGGLSCCNNVSAFFKLAEVVSESSSFYDDTMSFYMKLSADVQ